MRTKIILSVVILAGVLAMAACPKRTSVGDITANPARYYGKDVAIAGTVQNSYGVAMLGGVYKIDDGTGSIWVVTDRSVPSKGSQVGVKGRIQDGINYGGKNYGLAMVEDERRIAKR